jgi:hypothetical protein
MKFDKQPEFGWKGFLSFIVLLGCTGRNAVRKHEKTHGSKITMISLGDNPK